MRIRDRENSAFKTGRRRERGERRLLFCVRASNMSLKRDAAVLVGSDRTCTVVRAVEPRGGE